MSEIADFTYTITKLYVYDVSFRLETSLKRSSQSQKPLGCFQYSRLSFDLSEDF